MQTNVISTNKVSAEDAQNAIKTILRYIGENPSDDRLLHTPRRVIETCDQIFNGYRESADAVLNCKHEMKALSSNPIIIKDIDFHSICEHHLLPFSGKITVAYEPSEKIVGIGKIRKIVEIFSKRLQIQERITAQICETIFSSDLKPQGVAVFINAIHSCSYVKDRLSTQSSLTTMHFCGSLNNREAQKNLITMI
jgi:GTP cyclohydrolase I